MKKVGKFLFGVVEFVLIIYVVILTTFLLVRNEYGYTKFGYKTIVTINRDNEHYLKSFNKGDLIVLEDARYDDVTIGSKIYYYDVLNKAYIIKEAEVIAKEGGDAGAIYTISDGDRQISNTLVAGLSNGEVYNNLGSVLDFLESTVGFLIFVILPIMIIFIYQIYHLVLVIKEPVEDDKESEKKDA